VTDAPTALPQPRPSGPSQARPGIVTSVRQNLWFRFAVRRLASLIFVFAFLIVGVFLMVQAIPGDPVTLSVGAESTPEIIQRMKHENGFDKPLFQQFTRYVSHLFEGDLGRSFQTRQPVTELIRQRVGASLELAGLALAIVLLFAIPLGLLAAALTREGRHRRVEVGFMSATSIVGALPELLIGTLLVFVFAVKLGWLPAGGAGTFEQLVLPALTIALPAIMILSRVVRVETLNVLAQDYMRTARSKWLRPPTIYFRHVLPNVLTAALTIAGLLFAGLIGGAVIVEIIFARPGLGQTLVYAILQKEYSVAQGIILVLAAAVVLVNALVDFVLALLDPRSLARYA
jgi:peptide/nickel transport system permease protein